MQEPPPAGEKEVVSTPKNRIFQQQKSKQLNVKLLKEKLRLKKLVREKQIGDAQGLVMKDSIIDKQADNVSLPEKSLCNLNKKAPDPAIKHGASLTPTHVGGVLLAQIQDDDLCKLKDTVTDDAPLG